MLFGSVRYQQLFFFVGELFPGVSLGLKPHFSLLKLFYLGQLGDDGLLPVSGCFFPSDALRFNPLFAIRLFVVVKSQAIQLVFCLKRLAIEVRRGVELTQLGRSFEGLV